MPVIANLLIFLKITNFFAEKLHKVLFFRCFKGESRGLSTKKSCQMAANFAERPRFELGIRFWRIHAFQACLLSHSSISPVPLGLKRGTKVEKFCKTAKFFDRFRVKPGMTWFDRLTNRGSTGSPTVVRHAHQPWFDTLNIRARTCSRRRSSRCR